MWLKAREMRLLQPGDFRTCLLTGGTAKPKRCVLRPSGLLHKLQNVATIQSYLASIEVLLAAAEMEPQQRTISRREPVEQVAVQGQWQAGLQMLREG